MIANNLNNFQRYNYKEKLTWITKVFPWFLAEKMFHDCLMDFLIYKNKLLRRDFHLCKQIKRNCSRNRKPNYPLHWNWFPLYYSSSNFACMIKPIWAYQLASIPLETIRKPWGGNQLIHLNSFHIRTQIWRRSLRLCDYCTTSILMPNASYKLIFGGIIECHFDALQLHFFRQ